MSSKNKVIKNEKPSLKEFKSMRVRFSEYFSIVAGYSMPSCFVDCVKKALKIYNFDRLSSGDLIIESNIEQSHPNCFKLSFEVFKSRLLSRYYFCNQDYPELSFFLCFDLEVFFRKKKMKIPKHVVLHIPFCEAVTL